MKREVHDVETSIKRDEKRLMGFRSLAEHKTYLLIAKATGDEARSRGLTTILTMANDAGAEVARDRVADLATQARA